ncbi:MAG TPA: hypothetical protein VK655_06930 [Solirubrobacteraceae bacterium]|nr:hypothetical protein [Solirubrobacteraceae bacterium]
MRFEQTMSQLQEILQVSAEAVDEHGERKREAAHGLDRVTTFSGRKRHMSSPLLPIEGHLSLSSTDAQAVTSTEDTGSFAAGVTPLDTALDVVASRGGPPPYVLEQIAAAGRIDEALRDAGEHVRFLTADDGRTSIELQDRDGNAHRTLSVAEALELAAGRPLE